MTGARVKRNVLCSSCLTALVASALFVAGCADYTQQELTAATERMRDLYFLRDYETASREGEEWSERAPDAFELRAWYVHNRRETGRWTPPLPRLRRWSRATRRIPGAGLPSPAP